MRVTRFGNPGTILSLCVSSWIGTGERLFLLYGWATLFILSRALFPSIFSGLSHRRYVTSAVVLHTTRAGPAASSHTPVAACMHWTSHHPSQQQAHHSGLDVLQSFLSVNTGVLRLGPLCRMEMPRASFTHRMYVGTRQVYNGVFSVEVVSLTSRHSAVPARSQSPRRRLMRFRFPGNPGPDGTVIVVLTGRGSDRALL